AAGDVERDPAGQTAGQLAQAPIGGAGELGQQRQRLVGVVVHRRLDGDLVELADLRRDLLEARVAGQLAPRRGAPSALGDRLVGVVAFGRRAATWWWVQRSAVAPAGAGAFPALSLGASN